MKTLNKFLQISWGERWFLLEALTCLIIVRLAVKMVPFKQLATHLGQSGSGADVEINYATAERVRRIGWAIHVVTKKVPWKPTCLEQAITAKLILRHRRIPNTLYLGMAKNTQNILEAHAWTQSGSIIVTGKSDHQRFTNLISFSDHYA